MPFTDKVKESSVWSDKQTASVPEIDFIFSDGSDFVFSSGDFLFREATSIQVWSDKIKA